MAEKFDSEVGGAGSGEGGRAGGEPDGAVDGGEEEDCQRVIGGAEVEGEGEWGGWCWGRKGGCDDEWGWDGVSTVCRGDYLQRLEARSAWEERYRDSRGRFQVAHSREFGSRDNSLIL